MVSRRVAAERKAEFIGAIRSAISSGELRPGDTIPPLRHLAERYQLSQPTILQTLQPLFREGLLQPVQSVGIFVASPLNSGERCYACVTPAKGESTWWNSPLIRPVLHGFEERVTALGGQSLWMRADEFATHRSAGSLPVLHGVFSLFTSESESLEYLSGLEVNHVRYSSTVAPATGDRITDRVTIDNVDGGRQATQRLVREGHERIAFIGLHSPRRNDRLFSWSRERAAGWKSALEAAGLPIIRLEFRPSFSPLAKDEYPRAIADATRDAVSHRQRFTAVVGADDNVIIGFIEALRNGLVPDTEWPTMVGFEALPEAAPYVLTSVRPRWSELGATAAELLWERDTGRSNGPALERSVPMTVVSRLMLSRHN